MKDRKLFAVLSAMTALTLAAMACGGGAAETTPTAPPTKASSKPTETKEASKDPTATPEEPTAEPTEKTGGTGGDAEVAVSPLSTYVDEYGYYHVVGAIQNNTEDAIESIELSLTLVDDAGETVLTESDEPVEAVTFSPHLYTLAAGDTSTFDYTLYPDDDAKVEGWQPAVEVTDFDEGDAERAKVRVENQKLVVDEAGNFYLTGEIINEEDKGVNLDGIAGAILDKDENIVGADYGYGYAYYLYPASDEGIGSRTPYIVQVDGPIETADTSVIYFDAEIAGDDASAVDLTLQDTDKNNYYKDDYGRVHLVTAVTNNGKTAVSVRLVAGLYDKDGTVLDATSYISPIYIQPGETLPVSFDYFGSVNYNAEAADAIDNYTIKIDPHPFWTYETSFESINLPAEEAISNDESEADSSNYWTFKGTFTNSSDKALSSGIVMVVVTDKETGNIMATSYSSVYPEGDADSLAAGDAVEFEIYLSLDPEVDAATLYQYRFIVQGYPKD